MSQAPPRLTAALVEALVGWSAAALPHEAAGLLLKGHAGLEACPVEQDQPSATEVTLDPEAILRALPEGSPLTALVGTWHSHPQGPAAPSLEDLEGAAGGLLLALVAPLERTVTLYRRSGATWVLLERSTGAGGGGSLPSRDKGA